MLILVICWLVIGAAALVIGNALLARLSRDGDLANGDWLILSLWLGLIAIEWLALVVSLMTAVTPLSIGATVIAVAVAAFLAGPRLRDRIAPLCNRAIVGGALLVLLAAGFVASGLRPTPDTGAYHYPAIFWLAEYGTVTGVANIIPRFGFVTATWPLPAAFEHWIPGRTLPIVNGFILVLICTQVIVATARILRGDTTPGNLFLAAASVLVLALGLAVGSFTTPTPDLSVMALTILVAWRMFDRRENALLPLAFACGALDAKLSGALLLPVAGLFAVWGQPLRTWLAAAALVAIVVIPYFVAAIVTSGCFAFPAAASCVPAAWTLPLETAKAIDAAITEWARWAGAKPAGAAASDWLLPWLTGKPYWFNAVVFWFFITGLAGYLVASSGRISNAEKWILGLIAPGVILVFWKAPDLRFNYGLFLIPPALLFVHLAATPISVALLRRVRMAHPAPALTLRSAIFLSVLLLALATGLDRRRDDLFSRLVRPRMIPETQTTTTQADGFSYRVPANGMSCWGARLPCADGELSGIELRDRNRGIAGGFQSSTAKLAPQSRSAN